MLIQTAHAALVNALIAATADQEGFKNLENNEAYKVHQDAA